MFSWLRLANPPLFLGSSGMADFLPQPPFPLKGAAGVSVGVTLLRRSPETFAQHLHNRGLIEQRFFHSQRLAQQLRQQLPARIQHWRRAPRTGGLLFKGTKGARGRRARCQMHGVLQRACRNGTFVPSAWVLYNVPIRVLVAES